MSIYLGGVVALEEMSDIQNHLNDEIYCNCCGKPIMKTTLKNVPMDYLHIEKSWGYFSSKDLTRHIFNVCEKCYDKWVASFNIPVEEYPVEDIHVYTEEEIDILSAAYKEAMGGI